jgi:hypothetical protein
LARNARCGVLVTEPGLAEEPGIRETEVKVVPDGGAARRQPPLDPAEQAGPLSQLLLSLRPEAAEQGGPRPESKLKGGSGCQAR